MNNLILGGDGWTYYETIGGGQGASARGPGPSGVHVGMSNTLNTPIEALELEYPLRVEPLRAAPTARAARARIRGGDGIVRDVEVLEPATLSLLTDRRRHAPGGRGRRRGGSPGRQPARRRRAGAEGQRGAGARSGGERPDPGRRRLG